MGFFLTLYLLSLLATKYKYGVIVIAVVIQLLSYWGTGIPGVKIFTVVVLFALSLYGRIPYERKRVSVPYPKPLIWASLIFLFSFVISELYTRTNHHWETIVANSVCYFFFPFLLWKCLETRKDLMYFLRLLYILMLVAFICGICELILKKNYVLELFDILFTLEDFSFDDSRIRFGLKRCNSIFSYFTTYGIACCFSFTVFFYMRFYYQIRKKWLQLLIFAMPFCAFSTGSRAIFLGLFLLVGVLFLDERFRHSKYFQRLSIFAMISLPILLSVAAQVYFSIFHSEDYGGGSTSELRILQWEACMDSFLQSPIIGNGRMYIWDVVSPAEPILQGAESIWFSILVDYGILGAIAFVNLLIMCGLCLWKVDKKLISIPIAYLLILSLSPDSGVQYNILITFTIVHIKMNQLLKQGNLTLQSHI